MKAICLVSLAAMLAFAPVAMADTASTQDDQGVTTKQPPSGGWVRTFWTQSMLNGN